MKDEADQVGPPLATYIGLFAAATPIPRSIIRFALYLMKFSGLFRLARHVTRHGLRIICYHGFAVADEYKYRSTIFFREDFFRKRMDYLRHEGYPIFTFASCVGRAGGRPASALRHGDNHGRWLAWGLHGRIADNSGPENPSHGLRDDLLRREPNAGLYGDGFLLVLASHAAAGGFAGRDRKFRPEVPGGRGRGGFALRRLVDGGPVSDIEFVAEMTGFIEVVRSVRRRLRAGRRSRDREHNTRGEHGQVRSLDTKGQP
jgi:hypothetical protein